MSDVVEQGRPDGGGGLPPWTRRVGIAAALVAAAALLAPGLLESETASGPDRGTGPTSTASPAPTEDPDVVVRDGQQIITYDRFGVAAGPDLPPGLPLDAELVAVDNNAGRPAVLFTVAAGRLLRVDPGATELTDLGAATRVVDGSGSPGALFVQTAAEDGARVVSLDAFSGLVLDESPFSGQPAGTEWEPTGVVSLFDVDGLVLQQPVPGRAGLELAVAWETPEVLAGRRPALQRLGRFPALLGVTDEWVLLLDGRCPGAACRLMILSFGGGAPIIREVRAPTGWSFTGSADAGPITGLLVPVVQVDPAPVTESSGLARLAAGGDNALLVQGSTGVVHDAGVITQSAREVFFVRMGLDGIRRVQRWDPTRPGRASSLGARPPLSDSARLLCVCG